MRGNLVLELALTAVLAPAVANAQQSRPARLDSAVLSAHVSVLAHDSLEGRRVGTPGGLKAQSYLQRQFRMLGLDSLAPGYTMPFQMRERGGRGDAPPITGAANIVAVIRGSQSPDSYIVLSAHFDHLGVRGDQIFNGADDNASGTAAILTLARWFRSNPPRHSIIIAAFDAEESGLQGARAFVAAPPVPITAIKLNVNLDMVGRNDKDELYVTGTLAYPFLKPYIEQIQPGARLKLLMGHDSAAGGSPSDNWTGASDHGAFHAQGIPFLYFGEEDHPDYHRESDEFSRLMPSFHLRAAETVLDALLLLDANLDAIARASGRQP